MLMVVERLRGWGMRTTLGLLLGAGALIFLMISSVVKICLGVLFVIGLAGLVRVSQKPAGKARSDEWSEDREETE
ncbi:hypothetical protein BI347_12695 [Chromobacterium sphagni]|uniref:Uncharacterized protein n=1 Tax=Chromobacterium sphagni TaxID=1903179 RepID=A0A1S1X457_9NEIS|nr:hypothetical protein BI347_12695 [Chromobacterium sphagni]